MTRKRKTRSNAKLAAPVLVPRWRFYAVSFVMAGLMLSLVAQLVRIQVMPGEGEVPDFLREQGNMRTLRNEPITAYRGFISDRNGEPLAVSTPLVSVYINPSKTTSEHQHLPTLAKVAGLELGSLKDKLDRYQNHSNMSLRPLLPPDQALAIRNVNADLDRSERIEGLDFETHYRRYYPAGEVAAHVLGFTDRDDIGLEGLELAYNSHLTGEPGNKRVVINERRQVIDEIEVDKAASPGKDITLALDLRLQYIAYRELKAAVAQNHAESGSLVVLDSHTGEILALVNQPSFNPNDRTGLKLSSVRNRALVDQIEPGSTVKPFSIMAAMEAGVANKNTVIDTSPGYLHVGGKTFLDPVNYGQMDLTKIIKKSSQVGTTKLALKTGPEAIRDVYYRVGFGQALGTGFPGESVGSLPNHKRWPSVTLANYAFGYGFTTNVVQLAQAYNVIANNGIKKPVSLLRLQNPPVGERVIDEQIAKDMKAMLATVTQKGGTGVRAQLAHYSTVGKSGTAHLMGEFGYADDRYRSLFAGFAPLDDPRVVVVVVVSEPKTGKYYGGEVAAPVFAEVAEAALRLLEVPPEIVTPMTQMASVGGGQ